MPTLRLTTFRTTLMCALLPVLAQAKPPPSPVLGPGGRVDLKVLCKLEAKCLGSPQRQCLSYLKANPIRPAERDELVRCVRPGTSCKQITRCLKVGPRKSLEVLLRRIGARPKKSDPSVVCELADPLLGVGGPGCRKALKRTPLGKARYCLRDQVPMAGERGYRRRSKADPALVTRCLAMIEPLVAHVVRKGVPKTGSVDLWGLSRLTFGVPKWSGAKRRFEAMVARWKDLLARPGERAWLAACLGRVASIPNLRTCLSTLAIRRYRARHGETRIAPGPHGPLNTDAMCALESACLLSSESDCKTFVAANPATARETKAVWACTRQFETCDDVVACLFGGRRSKVVVNAVDLIDGSGKLLPEKVCKLMATCGESEPECRRRLPSVPEEAEKMRRCLWDATSCWALRYCLPGRY